MGTAGVAGDCPPPPSSQSQRTLCFKLASLGMGRADLCCHVCNVYDMDSGHVVQVRARDGNVFAFMPTSLCSARLPGSTVALFSTLQPLFTGVLGLLGILKRLFTSCHPPSSSFCFLLVSPRLQFCTRACPCRRVWVVLQSYLVSSFGA